VKKSSGLERFYKRLGADTGKLWGSGTMHLGSSGIRAPLPRWFRGAAWQEGLSDRQIQDIEGRWGILFPSDYRLFLRVLHAQKRRAAFYAHGKGRRVIDKGWVFFDCRKDEVAIRGELERLPERIVDGIRERGLWLNAWGAKPAAAGGLKRRIVELVHRAPPLLPVSSGNYIVSGPDPSPVFSLHPRTFEFWISAPTFAEFAFREFSPYVSPATGTRWEALLPASRRKEPVLPLWSDLARWCAERLP